jgi:hypothetical protein
MATLTDVRNMTLCQPGVIGARVSDETAWGITVEVWLEEEAAIERLRQTYYNNLPLVVSPTVRIMDGPVPADALPSRRDLPAPYIDMAAESGPQLAISSPPEST